MRSAAAPRHFSASELLSRVPRPSLKLALLAALAVVMTVSGWLWLRDSSFVAVNRVEVRGAHGFGAAGVRSALEAAGRDMTTLHIDEGQLRAAVARYPLVRDIRVQRDLPHTLKILVLQRTAVGAVTANGSTPVAVASDGSFLRGVPTGKLPVIASKVPPGGVRAADPKTRAKVAVLTAAPLALRRRIDRVTLGPLGLAVRLHSGLSLRFGGADRLEAKWIAVRRVMRDPAAAAATYIDVRIPERPAAGGLTELQGGAPRSAAETAAALQPNAVAGQDPGAASPAQDGGSPDGTTGSTDPAAGGATP